MRLGWLMIGVVSIKGALLAQDVAYLMAAVREGPSLYRTPEAVDYFNTRKPNDRAHYSEDRDGALRALRAAVLLGEKGAEAGGVIPVLIEKFPRAQLVFLRSDVHYSRGRGTFHDWVQTYAVAEKTKFLLGESLLEYATLIKCGDFITVEADPVIKTKKGQGTSLSEATVDIYLVITVHAGACALARLSGENYGTDLEAWRQWWAREAETFVPLGPTPYSTTAAPISSGGALVNPLLKAKYRMVLSTGDQFVGTLESVEDDKLIIETERGEPFQFDRSLVVEYALLALPPQLQSGGTETASGEHTFTFDELFRQQPLGKKFRIRLTSAAVFVGTLASIEDNQLKLSIEGSQIPISREVIAQISSYEEPPAQTAPDAAQQPPSAIDTLIVKNPQTDEFGRPLADITYVGTIVADEAGVVSLKLPDGNLKKFPYADIVRRISHAEREGFSDIERYGKVLICPPGMKLVDVPPGKRGRPFFKVCIDTYEAPNREGAIPVGNISYREAQENCRKEGKRLCTSVEWQFACSGLEEYPYPYGSEYKKDNCNSEGSSRLMPSGSLMKCVSKFGVYDMMGNIFEWVTGPDGVPMLMGGPVSKCQTLSPGVGGHGKAMTGYRCCKSN